LEIGITGHNFQGGPPKDHSTKVWLQLAQLFLRRRLKCEMLTDGRRMKSGSNSSHGLKARWAKNEYMLNYSLPCSFFCNLFIFPRLGWPPLKIVSGDPDFQPRWPPS
jgi:hypothetical protein